MLPAAPLVWVTRPHAQAHAWVQALAAHGVQAQALSLIEIAPAPDAVALQAAWAQIPGCAALMFVSANAVQHFMAARPAHLPLAVPLRLQAWGTGPGTQAALLAAGWQADLIRCPGADAPTFDSEALWALLCPHAPAATAPLASPVLVVRGANAQGHVAGRDWLTDQLRTAQVQVHTCAAYQRRAPVLTAADWALGHSALRSGAWWLFSSALAAQHAAQIWPNVPLIQARALATHPRIAQSLRQLGWGCVRVVGASAQAQAASIKSAP